MNYSYNQIIHEFETIATNNPFIKRFGAGEITDVEMFSPTSGLFPYLWIVPQGVDIAENTLTYTFRVMVFDIDNTDDSHQRDILSDTLRILIDVIKNFRYITDNDVSIEGTPTAVPFTHRFVDYCTGWYSDMRIITELDNNPCDTL